MMIIEENLMQVREEGSKHLLSGQAASVLGLPNFSCRTTLICSNLGDKQQKMQTTPLSSASAARRRPQELPLIPP